MVEASITEIKKRIKQREPKDRPNISKLENLDAAIKKIQTNLIVIDDSLKNLKNVKIIHILNNDKSTQNVIHQILTEIGVFA